MAMSLVNNLVTCHMVVATLTFLYGMLTCSHISPSPRYHFIISFHTHTRVLTHTHTHTHTHKHKHTHTDFGVPTTVPLDNSAVMNHPQKPMSRPPSWFQVTACKCATFCMYMVTWVAVWISHCIMFTSTCIHTHWCTQRTYNWYDYLTIPFRNRNYSIACFDHITVFQVTKHV